MVPPIDAEAASNSTVAPLNDQVGYTGSVSCRECHEKFYKLWASSNHGLAMQPYTEEFAKKNLAPQERKTQIGEFTYQAKIGLDQGFVLEKGTEGEKKYPITEVLGGKNVYYFLTPMERGRLQTLPVAFDVHQKEWFDTAASGLRHVADEPFHWRESVYTFNTACFSCHVSQFRLNYDLKADTYQTTWKEPGINCETCHGPAGEHIRVCREAPEGTIPKDLKITRGGRDFTHEQNNATCSTCHAKMIPITDSFKPGDQFFNHYDLITLESSDYYPDGRDLGENYTYTTWLLNPCVQSGELDCLHCHTSSGRFRQKKNPNQACLPCHKERVASAPKHTRHAEGSDGNLCISCHMPMTEFARMRRSDHSMLPPTPAATIEFESPNACNLCHADQGPQWADGLVRKWHGEDYQAPVVYRAGLIKEAREGRWNRLPEMIKYVSDKKQNEVFAASFIRLLRTNNDQRIVSAIIKALENPSPLVRGAAVDYLQAAINREAGTALVKALSDESRLVRIRAAASLAAFPMPLLRQVISRDELPKLTSATKELLASFLSRPDLWTSHYNLGNFYLNIGDFKAALTSYQIASRLEPGAIPPLINASIAAAKMGDSKSAEKSLNQVLNIDIKNSEAHFNMGLLLAEQKEPGKAVKHLRLALDNDPEMHKAAFNLCVLIFKDQPEQAILLCRKAYTLHKNPKYAYTLAYYLDKSGDTDQAVEMLDDMIDQWPNWMDAYLLLSDIYEKSDEFDNAAAIYRRLLTLDSLSPEAKANVKSKIKILESK